ncbi:serine protease, partial [Nonomuraea wenchangensis]
LDRPPGGYDTSTGFGVVSAARALSAADRLAGHTAVATGAAVQDPGRPLAGGRAGPVKVVVRDDRRVAVSAAIATAAGAGALASLGVIFTLVRRVRRAHSPQDA